MKLELSESHQGEFDLPPEVLEDKAIRAAKLAVLALLDGPLSKTFQSHTFMPKVGDAVKNTNVNCKHFKSEGIVTAINDLPGGAGKTISYRTTNDGKSWSKGRVLDKTPGQLDFLGGKMKKALSSGGEMRVLEDITKGMADLYAQRLASLKKDMKKLVHES